MGDAQQMTAGDDTLSILIATHNRRELLGRCLEALSQQTQDPDNFEVIVADDGSSDGSADMAAALETPYRLRVLRLDKGGKPAALNTALQAAEGHACLFLDDDIIASPGLVAAHMEAQRANPKALVLGNLIQRPPVARDWFAHAYADDWNRRYEEMATRTADWTDCYGANFSVPLSSLLEVGGFAGDLAAIEDIELGFRLCEAGCTPIYLPAATAVHDDEKRRGRMLHDTQRFGGFCSEFGDLHPSARTKLLGWFLDTTDREVMLRRALLRCGASPSILAALGRLIPGRGRRQVWFGFVSRYTFWRGVDGAMTRSRWRETTRGVPVLMYHAFGSGDEHDRYVLSERSLRRQMRLLAALRFRVITFGELIALLGEGRMPPKRTAVLTIDDGYLDNLTIADPVFRRHGFSPTIFLVSRKLGRTNDWTDEGLLADRPMLSEQEVRQLRDAGTELGGHTRSHRSLPGSAATSLDEELEGCRIDLEAVIGGPVTTFAYPYGEFDEGVAQATGAAGYSGACTVAGRRAKLSDDPLQIPRIEVRGTETIRSFLGKLLFGGN
jgi:glycosyltransferase involved in cell wall biosynthesis